MTCEKCGETIEPEEPDIRYRPGDSKTRYDYHSWCWLDSFVPIEELEKLADRYMQMKYAWDVKDKEGSRAFEYCSNELEDLIEKNTDG
jgi:hypothetical protein